MSNFIKRYCWGIKRLNWMGNYNILWDFFSLHNRSDLLALVVVTLASQKDPKQIP